jgi:hypothetical protein
MERRSKRKSRTIVHFDGACSLIQACSVGQGPQDYIWKGQKRPRSGKRGVRNLIPNI